MKIREGQCWEIRRGAAPNDPLVVEVLEVNEPRRECRVRTYLSSAPKSDLGRRRWESFSTITDVGVLVVGPGAPDPVERREQVAHVRQLVAYAARRDGVRYRGDIAIPAKPLQAMLTEDLGDPAYARMVLREAVGQLGGVENDVLVDESPWGGKTHEPCYVLPGDDSRAAA